MASRILIVDDRPVNRDLMRACLEPFGFELTLCDSASDALYRAHQQIPDLVISDVHMDPGSGILLCQHFKQDPALQAVPFMLFSASYPTPSEIAAARAAGAECCINRPIDPRELLKQVNDCLKLRGKTPAVEI